MPTRRRLTELQRETSRRTTAIALALGHEVAVGRRRIRMTQQGLAARVGISQSAVSRIERGDGRGTPLETWIALGIALGRPVAMSFSRPLDQPRGPADAGHLQIQEHVLALARASGRHGTFELPTRPSDPNRSTDVGLRDDRHQALIQQPTDQYKEPTVTQLLQKGYGMHDRVLRPAQVAVSQLG